MKDNFSAALAVCDRCLNLLSLYYKIDRGTLIIDRQSDMGVNVLYAGDEMRLRLVHQPIKRDGILACGGTLRVIASAYLPAGRYPFQIALPEG